MTDPLGALDPAIDERSDRRERRSPGTEEEFSPGRSLLRRDDPARVAARAGRVGRDEGHDRPHRRPDDEPAARRFPQQRRPEPIEEDGYRGRVLPRRGDAGDRPRGIADTGDRPQRLDPAERSRGVADTGDRPRRLDPAERPRRIPETGDVLRGVDPAERPRGMADTGDRPRRADTGDRPRRLDPADRARGVADTGDRPRRMPPETGDVLLRGVDPGERPRGVADTGDRPRRMPPETGDVLLRGVDPGERPRGVADTGDRPRGGADTGDRPRAARASVPVSGRAVVADPARRPAPEPGARPEAPGRLDGPGRHEATGRLEVTGRPDGRGERSDPPGRVHRSGARPANRPVGGEPEFVRRVNPFELPDPRGYSHATVATGQLVLLAGQTGVDRDGRIVDGDLVSQFDRTLQNLLTALVAAGGSPEHLVSVAVQVTSIEEYQASSRAIGRVWRARLGGLMPALTLSEVRRFWDPEAAVQITAQAVLPL